MTELNLFDDQLFKFLYDTTAAMNVTCDRAFFFLDHVGKEKKKLLIHLLNWLPFTP